MTARSTETKEASGREARGQVAATRFQWREVFFAAPLLPTIYDPGGKKPPLLAGKF